MGLRSIEGDEHYGHIGWGAVQNTTVDTFDASIIDAIIEPDFIIKTAAKKLTLDIDVKDVLVWDIRTWEAHINATPAATSNEDARLSADSGITKDNTINGNDAPVADTIDEGTQPGGGGAAVTGTAVGGPGTRTVGDEQPSRYEHRTSFTHSGSEEQTAVGQIPLTFETFRIFQYQPYRVDGNAVHHLLTAAHYHMWLATLEMQGTAKIVNYGSDARRMSVDLKELMFDRAVILSILDALVVSS